MDVGCRLRGFEASTMTLQHDSHSVIPPISRKIHNHLQRHISVRVHPHVHPQHIKVLKHIVYIWYGCGMQSTGLWSLNHDFKTWLTLRSNTPNFPKIDTHLQRQISVRVHPHVHPQHTRVLNHIVYVWYGCGMQFARLWSFRTTSLGGLHHAHNFHKFTCVRVHPCAHQKHIKVLKHFV